MLRTNLNQFLDQELISYRYSCCSSCCSCWGDLFFWYILRPTWKTMLSNFIAFRFETTDRALDFFEDSCPKKNKNSSNKMSSDMILVPDLKIADYEGIEIFVPPHTSARNLRQRRVAYSGPRVRGCRPGRAVNSPSGKRPTTGRDGRRRPIRGSAEDRSSVDWVRRGHWLMQ